MSSIRVIQGDFEKKLKLQFAPGYVQIGDVIINTNWDGEKFQNF